MLTGRFKTVEDIKKLGMIANFPRFQPDAFEHNLQLVNKVEEIAKEKGCTSGQLAIAWVRKHSNRAGLPTIVPIPGATTASRVRENAKPVDMTEDDFTRISDIVRSFETAGKRYPDSVPTNT
jgi:pyridoxine 4-dehydrogenase